MDSPESSKNKKQDTSSPSQLSQDLSNVGFQDSSSPTKTCNCEDDFLLDEHNSSTPPRVSLPTARRLFESDNTEGKGVIEDPCNYTKKSSLLSEKPNTVHQEKPGTYDDEAGNIQDVEYAEATSSSLGSNIIPLPSHISEVSASSVTSSKPSSVGVLHINSLFKGMGSAEGLKSKRMKLRILPTVHVSTINEVPTPSSRDCTPIFTRLRETTNLQGLQSSSSGSGGLVKGRKYIWQSMPVFPPVTLSTHSKTKGNDDHDDNKKTSPTDHAGNSEGFNQPRPKIKKRLFTADTEDFTSCTCKRSACAKPYCECFAAELYCAETCSCLGCLNRPEFRDKIYNIRKELRSCKPIAFAPKIIQNDIDIPSNNTENDTLKTPSSTRHINGDQEEDSGDETREPKKRLSF